MFRECAFTMMLLLSTSTALAQVSIRTDEQYPIRGEGTHVIVEDETGPMAGAIVQIEYRPNSSTARTETLEPTDQSGMTAWTPRDAGLVRISVTGPEGTIATTAVSIRFTRFEAGGIGIMLFAGLFLFGGAGYGMWLLMREQKLPPEEPPST